MATVNLSITRNNGVQISASGEVDDALVASIAQQLGTVLSAGASVEAQPMEEPAATA